MPRRKAAISEEGNGPSQGKPLPGFNPIKPFVTARCASEKDCGMRFFLQPHGNALPDAMPTGKWWCSSCGDMILTPDGAYQPELFDEA